MKNQIRYLLRRIGYDVVSYKFENKPHISLYHTFGELDKYPHLVFNAWRYGFKDMEARRQAHDFVRELLANYKFPGVQTEGVIPKHIWVFWGQGWENSPPIVKACRRQLEEMAQGFDIQFLDCRSLDQYTQIPDVVRTHLQNNPTTFSDLVRCALLYQYGGVWLDATCYVTQPFMKLYDVISGSYFSYTRIDKLLSTWLMASSPAHIIPGILRDTQYQWWKTNSNLPAYYWIHYLFEALCNEMPAFADAWSKRLYLSGCSNLLASVMDEPFHERVMQHIANETYVQKLSFKAKWAKKPINDSFAWKVIHGVE